MTQIALFDFSGLDEALVSRLHEAEQRISVHAKQATASALSIGLELSAIRKELEHGKFINWIEARLPIHRATAWRWMTAAETLGDQMLHVQHLTMKVIYEITSPEVDPEVRETAVTKAQAGETVTSKDVATWKRQAEEAKDEARKVREQADHEREQFQEQWRQTNADLGQVETERDSLEGEIKKLRTAIKALESRPAEVQTIEKIPEGYKSVADALTAAKKQLAEVEQQKKLKEADIKELERKAKEAQSSADQVRVKLQRLVAFTLEAKTFLARNTDAEILLATDAMTDPIRQEVNAIKERLLDIAALCDRALNTVATYSVPPKTQTLEVVSGVAEAAAK